MGLSWYFKETPYLAPIARLSGSFQASCLAGLKYGGRQAQGTMHYQNIPCVVALPGIPSITFNHLS